MQTQQESQTFPQVVSSGTGEKQATGVQSAAYTASHTPLTGQEASPVQSLQRPPHTSTQQKHFSIHLQN